MEDGMNTRIGILSAATAALLAGCAHLAPTAPVPGPLHLDTHVDIPLDYMRDPRYDVGTDTRLQVDLGKMERGGLDGAFFVVYVGQGPLTPEGYANAVAQAERKYSAIHMMVDKYPDRIRLATTPDQVRANHAAGLLSAMIGIENGYSLGHELSRLDAAYARGARYVGMSHVGNSDLCSSANPDEQRGEPAHNSAGDAGISDFGRAVVARANALGMMVDISHASDKCVRDVLALSKAPIIASHSSARAVVDVPRNLPDDLLRAIAAKGGVVQAVAYYQFVKDDPARVAAEDALKAALAKQLGIDEFDSDEHGDLPAYVEGMARIEREHPLATVADYVDHIMHMAQVAGIDHVGIASDFDGGGGLTGWQDATQTPNVTAELRRRGLGEDDIARLWGENLLRVWQDATDVADAAP
jgi:membrane dipeptidase